MSQSVIVTDVGPRDGLQNQTRILSSEQRLQLINALSSAGVGHVEVGAFVSPKVVPAMAGTDAILQGLEGHQGEYSVLIPNMKGYELATAAGANRVVMVLYASEGMAQANVNRSREQVEEAAEQILVRALEDKVTVLIAISVAFECPFSGPVAPNTVVEIAGKFLAIGADEIVISDTIGAANPAQVRSLMAKLVEQHG